MPDLIEPIEPIEPGAAGPDPAESDPVRRNLAGWRPITDHGLTGHVGRIVDMLIELEAAHDSIGWDNLPPTVYIVARDRDELVVCPVPLDHGHPRPLLVALAVGASKPENWPDLQHLYPAPPLAHILIMETWSRWAPMDNGEEAAFRAGRALADIPGSIEGRYGIAMLGDCDIHLARDRGEAPRILSNDYTGPTTASDRFDGVMYRALRQLHTATVNQYLAHHFARTGDTS